MDENWKRCLFETVKSKNLDSAQVFTDLAYENIDAIGELEDEEGETLLYQAAGYGRFDLVSFLLKAKADVNVRTKSGMTPLHNAAYHCHPRTSRKLIDEGADVDARDDEKGWTPLHFALGGDCNRVKICPRDWELVKILLDAGADPNIKTKSGRSCWNRISDSEDMRNVKVRHLLHKIQGCDDTTREQMIDELLEVEEYFELLRHQGEDADLMEALLTRRLLKSRLASLNNITLLHRAAGYNHLETASMLIRKGANVDATDQLGHIPLHNAATHGHIEMIEMLVAANSDVNKQDINGQTPLHVAASDATFQVCLRLIHLGANINLRCNEGKLAYDLAECADVKEVLKPVLFKKIPSERGGSFYIDLDEARSREQLQEPSLYSSLNDDLMLDSTLEDPFPHQRHGVKITQLEESDSQYRRVQHRMIETIRIHSGDAGGSFSTYDILKIEKIMHKNVWSKYRRRCKSLEEDYAKNEKLLFHGSNFIDKIMVKGFNVGYAKPDGMFGAGIYFAKHSSKSNQYSLGYGQGCPKHKDKSCYLCERKMIYAQVALGRSLLVKDAMPGCPHGPPDFDSVTAHPDRTDHLVYPEYVVYKSDQAYPLFVITYKLKK